MAKRILRVGSRDSLLAVTQTNLVIDAIKRHHPELEVELVTLKTTGDLILDKTLDKIGGKGLFVKELDAALLAGRVDITVHSLKDMPMEENPELPIVGLSAREDPRDVLVLAKNDLGQPVTHNIGSSSARRQIQLAKLFEQPKITSVRGNIVTRLRKLDEGQYSALVLAASGLKRAGFGDRISRYFSTDEMIPAAGQGILAVQARKDTDVSFLREMNSQTSWYAAEAEREFVRTLNGGCSAPIAAYAQVTGNELLLTGLYYKEETGRHAVARMTGSVQEARALGRALAEKMLDEVK